MHNFLLCVQDYSPLITALSTTVYVILTLFILIQMRKERIAYSRPYINVRTYTRDRAIECLLIKNVGKTAAINVKLDLNRDLFQYGDVTRNIRTYPIFRREIRSIPPSTEYHVDLAQYQLFHENTRDDNIVPVSFEITARYSFRSIFRLRTVMEKTDIDMVPTYLTQVPPGDVPSELKMLNDNLKKIIEKL